VGVQGSKEGMDKKGAVAERGEEGRCGLEVAQLLSSSIPPASPPGTPPCIDPS
jgi:hypothetical protein